MSIVMHSLRSLLILSCILCNLSSCSLDYTNISDAKSSSPEFVFYDAGFSRTENNKKTVQMNATKLEQYSGIDAMYLEGVSFSLYDSSEQQSLVGSCKLLSADMENEIFHFFEDVHITSYEYDAKVDAQNLRWNNKTETLSSGFADKVSISTGNTQAVKPTNNLATADNSVAQPSSATDETQTYIVIEGTGFSARGIDLSYSFDQSVTGSIVETAVSSTEEKMGLPLEKPVSATEEELETPPTGADSTIEEEMEIPLEK